MLAGVDTLRTIRMQLDIYANTIATATAVRNRVGQLLHGKTGTLGTQSIQFCYVDGEQDLSDLVGDRAIRRISFQLSIMAHEGY